MDADVDALMTVFVHHLADTHVSRGGSDYGDAECYWLLVGMSGKELRLHVMMMGLACQSFDKAIGESVIHSRGHSKARLKSISTRCVIVLSWSPRGSKEYGRAHGRKHDWRCNIVCTRPPK